MSQQMPVRITTDPAEVTIQVKYKSSASQRLSQPTHLSKEGPAGCHKLIVDEPLRQQPIIIS
jgi:hypothetical protein